MTEIFNRATELEKRRRLRQQSTPSESLLWEQLRNRKLGGYKFRRQYSIDLFVVDFYCPEAHLAIELDGSIHCLDEIRQRDKERERYIANHGIRFLRLSNEEIQTNLSQALEKILKALQWT